MKCVLLYQNLRNAKFLALTSRLPTCYVTTHGPINDLHFHTETFCFRFFFFYWVLLLGLDCQTRFFVVFFFFFVEENDYPIKVRSSYKSSYKRDIVS